MARVLPAAIALLFVTTSIIPAALSATTANPEWSAADTRWDVATTLPQSEVDRFANVWTARFLDEAGLQAYLDRPGLYDDGFNDVSTDDKAALIVRLIEHWQATLPTFGSDFWTGDAAKDQKNFEELAIMLYSVIFAKDELRESMAAPPGPAEEMGSPGPSSTADLTAQVEALHLQNREIVVPAPLPTPVISDAVPFTQVVPLPPVASTRAAVALDVPASLESLAPEAATLAPVTRLRSAAPPTSLALAPPSLDVPGLDDLLSGLNVVTGLPTPEQIVNLAAGGTYLACGSLGTGAVHCAAAPSPLGTPVLLDLDGNPLTPPEVTVLLTPVVDPAYLSGFTAELRVDRALPSLLPGSAPLPGQVYVLYQAPGAATQVLAGFDGRDGTLADTQSVRVTLKDVALALAGDVRVLGELTRSPQGTTTTLLAGFARVDTTSIPAVAQDPTVMALHFDPAPALLTADLRFAEVGLQRIIDGHVQASLSPTVTVTMESHRGTEARTLVGIVESMPTDLTFHIVTEAVGATHLDYAANAPFPRFELHDVLTPDTAQPSVTSTLDAIVHGVPEAISFDLARPFGITYSASARVTDATIQIASHDGAGVVRSVAAHVEGVPSQWTLDGTISPLVLQYDANGLIDVADATMTDRTVALSVSSHAEAIPEAMTLSVEDDHLVFTASQPIGLVEAQLSLGALTPTWLPGEFASLRANGAGALAAATRIAGFTFLDVDTRTTDHLLANVAIAGGEPFRALVDTPDAYATAYLSNLPTHISLDLAPNAFLYDLAQPVSNLTIHAEVGTLAADVIVNDLPDQLALSWNGTQMVYDANAAITRVRAWLDLPTLDAFADVQGIPADWTARWPEGTVNFSTPGTIGSALVQASVSGGSIVTLSGDHATVTQTGAALGASLRLSGVKALSADPRSGGSYALTLSPGGQPFNVYANLNGLVAQAHISNLPTQINLDLTPGTGRFAYTATTTVSRVWASADAATGPLFAYADLLGLPARVNVTWSLAGSPSLVFNASAPVTSIYAFARSASNSVYEANIATLPAYIAVTVGANDMIVDARTAWNAASASGTVGAITARYGSDGYMLYNSGNYADLYQSGSITRASVGYNGLKYLRVNTTNDLLFVDVQNSAPRYFTVYADTPAAYATLVIDNVPAHVRVTGNGVLYTYNAYGSTVNEIAVYFFDRAATTLIASIRGIPGYASLSMDMPNHALTYAATTAVSAIDVDAWVGNWYGLLRLTSIPTAWSASFADGDYGFDAGSGNIGSVRAVVTNHGTWTSLHGNHVSLVYVAPTGGDPIERAAGPIPIGTPEIVDASLLMTSVQKAQYKRVGTNNEIDLRMGGGTPFNARLNATLSNGAHAYLSAGFTPLPASIQGSFGERTTIATNTNFDLSAYAHYGAPAALANAPTPPIVHGASVRDGASGAARAVKAQLWITGLPTALVMDAKNGTFSFTNWRPTTPTLTVDGKLNDLLATPVDFTVQQLGIPNPQSLSFVMTTTDLGSGQKRVKLDLTQTAPMGALTADAIYGVQHGRVIVSNIPDDIHATYLVQNGQTTFSWDATAAITSVYAGVRVTSASATMQGYVSLAQLPSDFALTFGRASGGNGPTLSYSANANTLDMTAFVDANLYGGDLKARLSFQLTDLGTSVSVTPSGSSLAFTSTPATGRVYAAVWGSYNYYQSGSGVWDAGGWLEYPWQYHIGVNPNVNNLQVELTNFSSFTLQWGVVSKFSGNYGVFNFSWDQINVWLDVGGSIQIRVDWPTPFGSSTITLASASVSGWLGLNVLFHKYTNHEAYWMGVSGWAICDWDLWTTMRPHPHGMQWNGVSTSGGTAEGGAWYATPNPWGALSPWIVDLVTKSKSPDGGAVNLHFDYDCWP